MAIIDIFRNNAFSTTSLIAALENTEYLPGRLGQLNVFTPNPIRTESVSVEIRKNGSLSVIPTSPRGAPLQQISPDRRHTRSFNTHRIGIGDRITASELAFVRQFGEEEAVRQVQAEIARRWNGPTGMISRVNLTLEHMRLGAIQGKMIDHDGTVLEDWTNALTVPGDAPITIPTITFDFSALNNGELREKLIKIKRDMARTSDGVWTPQTKIHVMVGDDFMDKLVKNEEVREYYKNRVNAANYVENYDAFSTIELEGFVFENYRGTDDESTVAIGTNDGHAFPTNAPGAFEHIKAPGESFSDLGAIGKDLYSLITPDPSGHDRFVDLETIAYPLMACMRPKMLRKFVAA